MKFFSTSVVLFLFGCTCLAVTVTDSFTADNQTVFATNDTQIAAQIGADWKRANPADEAIQYRIFNNALDIGAVGQEAAVTKASLVNTAATTLNTGNSKFTLSAVLQQNTSAGSASIGLIFNYQDNGDFYLFRITGGGAAQLLVYDEGVLSTGFSTSGAFTPVQNRPYKITVSSSDPGTFDIRVQDTVDQATVYAITEYTLPESFAQYQNGVAGMYGTSGLVYWDDFSLETSPVSLQQVTFTDDFNRADTDFATNDLEISSLIGSSWKRANPTNEATQYSISDNAMDIGTVGSALEEKAALINTSVGTLNAGDGVEFTLSATVQQNTTAGSASIGLIFNYQDNGNYYLFRFTGSGAAQLLVYENGVLSTGFSTSGAFTPIQNRPYRITVSSSDPGTFDINIQDTVDLTTVYSITDYTLPNTFVTHQNGLGGMFGTSGQVRWDDFSLQAMTALRAFGLYFLSN